MAGDPTDKSAGRISRFRQWNDDRKANKAAKNAAPQAQATAAATATAVREVLKDFKDKDPAAATAPQGGAHAAARQSASVNVDPETLQGGDTTTLMNRLIAAIRHSQKKVTLKEVSDSLIREVVCNERFIQKIQDASVLTPLEPLDEAYRGDMLTKRARLASQLLRARDDPDYMIVNPTKHELDIIIVTMLGNAELWEKTPQSQWSPEGRPKPPEAFLLFLEGVAQDESPGKEGAFIANVLKDLTLRHSFTENQKNPKDKLVDAEYVERYVSMESTPLVKWAAGEFERHALTLLETPTSVVQPDLDRPGIGHREKYAALLATKEQSATDATTKAEAARNDAKKAVAVDAGWQKINADAEANGSAAVPTAGGGTATIAKGDPRLLKAVADAADRLKAAIQAREAAEAHLRGHLADRDTYAKNSSPEAIAAGLAQRFERFLIAAKDAATEENVNAAMADKLENAPVMKLAKSAEEIFTWRNTFSNLLIMSEIGRIIAPGAPAPAPDKTLEKKKMELTEKINAFNAAVQAAALPDYTKARFMEVAEQLGNLEFVTTVKPGKAEEIKEVRVYATDAFDAQRSYIASQLTELKNEHGQPLRKVIKLSLDNLKKRKDDEPIGITNDQRVDLRRVFKAGSGKVREGEAKAVGFWGRWGNRISEFVLNPEWLKGGAILFVSHVLPGKQFLGVYDWQNKRYKGNGRLHPSNMFQRYAYPSKDDDGHDIESITRVPNILVGSLWLGAKSYFIYTPIVFGILSATGAYHIEKKEDRSWVWPPKTWTYFNTAEDELDYHLYADDSWDIAKKLPDRDFDYYKTAYGAGRVLPGDEQHKATLNVSGKGRWCDILTCERNVERLHWLQKNPDVLTLFQERTSMKHYVHHESISAVVNEVEVKTNCSTGAEMTVEEGGEQKKVTIYNLPDTCTDSDGLNLGDWKAVAEYTPVTRKPENWDKSMGVCCTLRLITQPIEDGLHLNRFESDRFLEDLMRIETEGLPVTTRGKDGKETVAYRKVKLDYKFLTSPEAMSRWTKEGYLVTENDMTIMATGVSKREYVVFLRTQGGGRISQFMKMSGAKGEAEWRVKDDKREEFVGLWTKKVKAAMPGVNLGIAYIPDEQLASTFNSALEDAKKSGWVDNTKHEFERRQVAKSMEYFRLKTDTALDALVWNKDIHELLGKFLKAGVKYHVNTYRSDEFVQKLAEHKSMGKPVSDYDPFTSPQGYMVQSAVGEQLLVEDAMLKAITTKTPVLSLTDEAREFYTAQTTLNDAFTGAFISLRSDEHADGQIAKKTLWRLYNGDEAKMSESLQQAVYMWVTTGKDLVPDITVQHDSSNSITGVEITPEGYANATKALRMRMLDALKGMMPEGPMPVPELGTECQEFYPANSEFGLVVDEVITALHTTKMKGAGLTETVLKTVFMGDQAKMDDALKDWVYRELAATTDLDTYQANTGIAVSKDNEGKVISAAVGEGKDEGENARKAIKQRIVDLLEWVQLPPDTALQNSSAGKK